MSTPVGLDQRQYIAEERAWAASVLPGAAAKIERAPVFRALLAELIGTLVTRSETHSALIVLCPRAASAVERYYSGRGPELRNLLARSEVGALDAWIAAEVRWWTARWSALDPSRRGSASSTREAIEEVKREIAARPLPAEVARIAAKLQRPCG